MSSLITRFRTTLSNLIRPKSVPFSLTGGQWSGTSYVDSFKRNREPTQNELLAELKNTAFTCASINASVCAAFKPRLYVVTSDPRRQAEPRCLHRPVDALTEKRLRSLSWLPQRITKAAKIAEVLDHPIMTLLDQVNPVHNAFHL
jgi:hypothetical protein